MRISKESWIIACIGVADLVTTLVWVHYHGAREANPLFAHYLAMGFVWFTLMKIVLLAGPILLLEWARGHRPMFTRRASQFAIAAYLCMYGVGVAKLNPNLFKPQLAQADVVARVQAPIDSAPFIKDATEQRLRRLKGMDGDGSQRISSAAY